MSPIRKPVVRLLMFGGLAVAAGWLAFGVAGGQAPTGAGAPSQPTAVAPTERPADQDAVRKALDGFVAAFQKGDAKALAANWTTEGEYVSDDGTTLRGRAALEKGYAEFFTKSPDHKLEVEVEKVRFPSRDTAIVEGHFKVSKTKGGEFAASKCSFLYTREDGNWLIAIVREWPGDGHSIRDLEWLIGTWESKKDGSVVTTTYEWTANKAFIRCRFSVTKDAETHTGTQMYGRNPSTGAVQSWTFEDTGGIGDSTITRDGKKWVHDATGVTPDGRVLTSTNILTPVDADSFLWHSVERTLDGEPQPDVAPIKVVRVKAKR